MQCHAVSRYSAPQTALILDNNITQSLDSVRRWLPAKRVEITFIDHFIGSRASDRDCHYQKNYVHPQA